MKNHAMVIFGCILVLLTLFGCGNEIPPELVDVTMDGNLDVSEDFYVRNKPEPVLVEYNVKLNDTSGTVGEMIIGVKIDLFRFDAATGDFVLEQTLEEDPSVAVMCNEEYSGSTNWVYDRQATASTYKIILEATMDEDSFSVASDLFVIWKSPGAPKGHAKRDLKKMDQVEKLITRLDGYYGIYEAAKQNGYIVGNELVVIHEETMTVEEAVTMAETFEMNAIEKSDQAMAYFDAQDYETCFVLAKTAARKVHSVLTIYHALLAQARDMCDSN
jgi:hypothetical protein